MLFFRPNTKSSVLDGPFTKSGTNKHQASLTWELLRKQQTFTKQCLDQLSTLLQEINIRLYFPPPPATSAPTLVLVFRDTLSPTPESFSGRWRDFFLQFPLFIASLLTRSLKSSQRSLRSLDSSECSGGLKLYFLNNVASYICGNYIKVFRIFFFFVNTLLWAKQATLPVYARHIHYVDEKLKHNPSQLMGFP